MFVDYAGQTIDIVNGLTGEVQACQLFVAVLGASSYTYAEATCTQSLPDWCGSHERAFKFFGAVPIRISYDNGKVMVAQILGGRERQLTEGFLKYEVGYRANEPTGLAQGEKFCRREEPPIGVLPA